jgi:hypothetical protein
MVMRNVRGLLCRILILIAASGLHIDVRSQLTGKVRDDFIKNTLQICFNSQRDDKRNSSVTDKVIFEYCKCYTVYIANSISNQIVAEVEGGQRPLSAISNVIPLAGKYCAVQLGK